ncbi:MAG: hypothetical protein M3M97_07505 [Actinomycetota bacterium]|nr:hypothetical protein [Actinomycetota bacterium]
MVKRIVELMAMLAVGDGVIALAAPRRHSLLWRFGPEGYKRAMEAFAERPALTRLMAAVEVSLGLWLALSQYEEG